MFRTESGKKKALERGQCYFTLLKVDWWKHSVTGKTVFLALCKILRYISQKSKKTTFLQKFGPGKLYALWRTNILPGCILPFSLSSSHRVGELLSNIQYPISNSSSSHKARKTYHDICMKVLFILLSCRQIPIKKDCFLHCWSLWWSSQTDGIRCALIEKEIANSRTPMTLWSFLFLPWCW